MEHVGRNNIVCSAWTAWVAAGIGAFAVVGCGSVDDPERVVEPPELPAAALEGCDAIDLEKPEAGKGMQVSIEMTLAPGEERQVCKLVKVDHGFNLNWADGIQTNGSHHGLTARTNYRGAFPTQNIRGEAVDDPTQVATCESLTSDWDTTTILGAGRQAGASNALSPSRKGVLPDDVALRIEKGEVLAVNFHMLNPTDRPVHGCYKQNLYGIPDEDVKQEAGYAFYYNAFITVPAGQKASAKMACPVTEDISLASQVSHMHKHGVGYTATLLDGDPLAGGKPIQELYKTTDWEEPVARVDTPALQLKAGQWIQWECEYQNDGDVNIAQGQETTDEMCMFTGKYWPRSDAMDFCMREGGGKWSAARPLTNGTMNGQQFIDCYVNSPQIYGGGGPKSAPSRYASQLCMTQLCEKVGGRLNEFGTKPSQINPAQLGCE